jgi:hypothetical protein
MQRFAAAALAGGVLAGVAIPAAAGGGAANGTTSKSPTVSVVRSGLNNPRQITGLH